MVQLHEQHLRSFVKTWRNAKELDIKLPETNDTDYQSLETLLRHVLRAARGYMTWMCEKLDLPDAAIDPAPEAGEIESVLDAYIEHLIERWKHPLHNVASETEPLSFPDELDSRFSTGNNTAKMKQRIRYNLHGLFKNMFNFKIKLKLFSLLS